jgi:hypothetical protein
MWLGKTPVSLTLSPPQIPQGLTRGRTQVSAAKGQRLTAWNHKKGAKMSKYSWTSPDVVRGWKVMFQFTFQQWRCKGQSNFAKTSVFSDVIKSHWDKVNCTRSVSECTELSRLPSAKCCSSLITEAHSVFPALNQRLLGTTEAHWKWSIRLCLLSQQQTCISVSHQHKFHVNHNTKLD